MMSKPKDQAIALFEAGKAASDIYDLFPDTAKSTLRRWQMEWKKSQMPTVDEMLQGLQESTEAIMQLADTPQTQEEPQTMTELDSLEAQISQTEGQIAKLSDELANLEGRPIPEPIANGSAEKLLEAFQTYERAKLEREIRLKALASTIEALSQQLDSLELSILPLRREKMANEARAKLGPLQGQLEATEAMVLQQAEELRAVLEQWRSLAMEANQWHLQLDRAENPDTLEHMRRPLYGVGQLTLPMFHSEGLAARSLHFQRQPWQGQASIPHGLPIAPETVLSYSGDGVRAYSSALQ